VEFGSGARELAKGLKKRNVEACVVLVRARDRGLRLRGGLSSAAMRWQPADARGSRGALGAEQRGGKGIRGMEKATRGGTGSRRWTTVICTAVAGGELHHRRQSRRAEKQGTEGVQRKKKRGRRFGGLFCENQKLQGPHRKEEFPADLGVF
jgi:hypothetical protein